MSEELLKIVATGLAGVVFVPLFQVLKKYLHLDGIPAQFVAFIFSLIYTTALALAFGVISLGDLTPETVFYPGTAVFAVSQMVYRILKERFFSTPSKR